VINSLAQLRLHRVNSAFKLFEMPAILLTIVGLNVLWKYYVDRADNYIVSYIGFYHKELVPILSQKQWWEFFLPIPELNGGVWATTGILGVYALELLLNSPVRAYYFVTSLAIIATFLVSWHVYRSLLLSSLIGLCFALSTYDYVSYALSGGVIIPLVITFAVFYSYCQYQLFQEKSQHWLWVGLFLFSLILYALSYEGWLDYLVFQWVIYPLLAYLFYRQNDRRRMRTAFFILLVASIASVAYILVKVAMSYQTLHAPGLETDMIFNYKGRYMLIGVEDVIVNFITFFFTTITTYWPPQLFNFSLSSWYFGDETILELQNGYHPTHTQLVVYSHLFLWRFYAGIAITLFCILYFRALRKLTFNITPVTLSFFLFMTLTLVGSPTHALVKMRPMHSTPLLGYQIYLSIIGFTCLICFGIYHLYTTMRNRRLFYLLLTLFLLNLFYCALVRPSFLSHMSVLSGLGPYPDPLKNLSTNLQPQPIEELPVITHPEAPPVEQPEEVIPDPLPDSPQLLPTLANWHPADGVTISPLKNGFLIEGDDTQSGYQITSPLVPVQSNSQVMLSLQGKIEQGKVCLGILDQTGQAWLVSPAEPKMEYRFNSNDNQAIQLVVANCNTKNTGNEPSRFMIYSGSYAILEN
jgi:hypothetical protein